MTSTDEKILEEILRGQRTVLELSVQRCRRILLLLVRRIRRENSR